MGWLDFDEMIIRLRTLWMNTCLENDIVDTNDEGNFYDDYYLYSLIVFNIYTEGAKCSKKFPIPYLKYSFQSERRFCMIRVSKQLSDDLPRELGNLEAVSYGEITPSPHLQS